MALAGSQRKEKREERYGLPVERFDEAKHRQCRARRVGRKSALARSLDCQIGPAIWLRSLTLRALFRLHHGLIGRKFEPCSLSNIQPQAVGQSSIRAWACSAAGMAGASKGSATMCSRCTSGACSATEA